MKLETLESREEVESELESLRKAYDERTPEFWVALYDAVWLFILAEKKNEMPVIESK